MLIVLAAIDIPQLLTLLIGTLGVSGLVFTALRWRRDDTTAVVTQQDTIVNEMKVLNDELRTTTGELRTERDGLREQVAELTTQVKRLSDAGRETEG